MSLTAEAISELTTESAAFNILNEWLGLWFDGATHTVGSNAAVTFPRVSIAFGQSAPAQPMHNGSGIDAEIRCVIFPRSEMVDPMDSVLFSGKLATDYVLIHFWVSAKKPGHGQSELLAETIGQLLKAILTNPDAKYPLAEKGILNLQPKSPEWLRSVDYAKRLVAVVGQLQYPIQFGPPVTPPPDDGEQSLNFQIETPLLEGEYLLGVYAWNARVMQLTGAVWTAWPSTGDAVVLGLEVAGVLTGDEFTIEPGVPNQDVTGNLALNVTVAINQTVRWKVLSAPPPELSAWHVTVNLQAQPE
jgi:hypothetical protein